MLQFAPQSLSNATDCYSQPSALCFLSVHLSGHVLSLNSPSSSCPPDAFTLSPWLTHPSTHVSNSLTSPALIVHSIWTRNSFSTLFSEFLDQKWQMERPPMSEFLLINLVELTRTPEFRKLDAKSIDCSKSCCIKVFFSTFVFIMFHLVSRIHSTLLQACYYDPVMHEIPRYVLFINWCC